MAPELRAGLPLPHALHEPRGRAARLGTEERRKMFAAIFKGRRTAIVMGTAAAVAAAGATTWAAIPDTGGAITSCYSNTSGAMRVVDSATTTACPTGETQLKFNQRGQTGPTGPRGAAGPAGPVGVRWAKFGTNKLLAASEKPYGTYAYGAYGYNYVAFNGVDVSKCAVTVTAGTVDYKYHGITTSYMNYANQYVLAYAMDAGGSFVPNIPMDIVVNCAPNDAPYVP
jgi:hypothetical protein